MMKSKKEQAIERLQRALDEIPNLAHRTDESPEFLVWFRNARVTLRNIFGENSSQYIDFAKLNFSPDVFYLRHAPEGRITFGNGLRTAAAFLESMIGEIEEDWMDDVHTPAEISQPTTTHAPITNQVFVVHGRDDGTRETVARYLEGVGLEPVILQEQPNEGRTIIEKFEDYAESVGFAVAIFTPDDVGALATEPDNFKPRMRQNVVLELGYFAGKLGRKRVCALVKGEIEKPSDYDGVIYINLDGGEGWKLQLARELRAAGLQVNMDGLL